MLFLPLLALVCPFISFENETPDYRSCLITEQNERGNYTVTGIKSGYLASDVIRIYRFDEQPIDEIDEHAFEGTSFSSIVISKDITHISQAVFDNATNIKTVRFTGSKEQFAEYGLSFDIKDVFPYSVDEGFIYYWNTNIRTNEFGDICAISQATFSYVYSLYSSLEKVDLDIVNAYVDLAGASIEDSMKVLINKFTENRSQPKNDEWNQTGAISLIIVISIIGMTSITIFFLLKTKKIID